MGFLIGKIRRKLRHEGCGIENTPLPKLVREEDKSQLVVSDRSQGFSF
ncbi:hypothetical protein HMPREF9176_0471 [Streptococcus downei F0415]|nr:hypothetical protein HMPREF9176_0471 [Streptococcus downei F0415]